MVSDFRVSGNRFYRRCMVTQKGMPMAETISDSPMPNMNQTNTVAERAGFEPARSLRPYAISSRARSSTPAPLRARGLSLPL